FGRNDVTANAIYDHVNVQGWGVGINVPVNGNNLVLAGKFDNLQNILITTSNGKRVVDINDAPNPVDPTLPNPNPNDQVQFLDKLGAKLKKTQWDIYLQSNFNPKEQDITKLFSPDVIQMGTVRHN